MTSNLKCPFCGKKLWYDEQDGIYRCMKSACVMDYEGGTEKLWQELMCTRKALESAVNTLHWYNDNYDSVVAQETINEITSLTQGSNNE